MDISFSMPEDSMILSTGFGQAGYHMAMSLQKLGHNVGFKNPDAPVELAFTHPPFWSWSNKEAHHIGMAVWESTKLPAGWLPRMKHVDELWTASPVIAQWFEAAGAPKAHVYEHGVDCSVWKRKKRRPYDGVLRFLSVGSPASRKNAQMALDAFRAAFGDQDDVHLTIKAYQYNNAMAPGNKHPHRVYKNVSLIKEDYSQAQQVHLTHLHDVLVYPSSGEGFGLIPLEAMATGMPVICTEAWAGYKRFILKELRLSSELGESPWPNEHPGNVFLPDFDHLVALYREAYANFDYLSNMAYANSFKIEKEYDWTRLTEKAFAHVVGNFG